MRAPLDMRGFHSCATNVDLDMGVFADVFVSVVPLVAVSGSNQGHGGRDETESQSAL